jgi:GNAT superfamily N-acetyltransferase
MLSEKQLPNNSSAVIRPALSKDVDRILELVQELATYEKEPEAVTVSKAHFEESGFGANPVWWALVAEVDGAIQGFALYYIRFSTWKGQRMYLEDLVVTENYRGKGLGKALFDALIKEGKEKKLNGMVWQVLSWNEPAKKFYKSYQANFDNGWENCSIDF